MSPRAKATNARRRVLVELGRRGDRVRVVVDKPTRKVVAYFRTAAGLASKKTWPDLPASRDEAVAWAEGYHAERARQLVQAALPAVITLRTMWDRYTVAVWDDLRPTTRVSYKNHWGKFELYAGASTLASDITRERLDEYRAALRRQHTSNQVRAMLATVLRVFRWAVDRDLVPPSKVTEWKAKQQRDERPLRIDEYTRDDAERILAQFDPRSAKGWRGFVAITLFALTGGRQTAARHLAWDDVDLGTWTQDASGAWRVSGATITWRRELDKIGERDRVQPVPSAVAEALWIAYGWAVVTGYRGPFILYRPAAALRTYDARVGRWSRATRRAKGAAAASEQPWTYSAFHKQLTDAEDRAGVAHKPFRGAHGFRRLVVGDVLAATGNLVTAGAYIGDQDVKTLRKSYVRDRAEDLRAAADTLETARGAK